MEIAKEVKVYRVTLICDKCKEGTLTPVGTALMTTPMQFPHRCNKCSALENYTEQYPKTVYKEIDDEEGSPNHD